MKFSHREIPVTTTGVPAMRTGVPCNENRVFPVWKTSQGKPCSGPVLALYRIAVQQKLIRPSSVRYQAVIRLSLVNILNLLVLLQIEYVFDLFTYRLTLQIAWLFQETRSFKFPVGTEIFAPKRR